MDVNALRKAGKIASKVRNRILERVEVGMRLLDICEAVEGWTRELGGAPAFPCNVDLNHVAAHYTSPPGDSMTVPPGSLVKIDIGVHVDGYIADTAVTACFDPRLERLVEAAEAALEAGIGEIKDGVRGSEVGAIIERAMRRRGVSPIRNLTGHKVARFVVHAGKVVPNVSSIDGNRLRAGDVYAVEPFTTLSDAAGEVVNGPSGSIYLFQKRRSVKSEAAKDVLKFIQAEYRTLPFALRWVAGRFPGSEGTEAFSELLKSRCLYAYPQLVERTHKPVAQAEHTVVVTADGCEVITA